MKFSSIVVSFLLLFSAPNASAAAEAERNADVRLPLDRYEELMLAAKERKEPNRPAPSGYALGQAQLEVNVTDNNRRKSGKIELTLTVRVLEDQWVLVPILPAGAAVRSATVNGTPAQLIADGGNLAWGSNSAGTYQLRIDYDIDALASAGGYSLPIPVPEASGINLTATLPGTELDVAVIPSAGVTVAAAGGDTRITASVPAARGIQLSWRTPQANGYVLSRAAYDGELREDAVAWTAELSLEVFEDGVARLPFLPSSVTLSNVLVDGKESAVYVKQGFFTTTVRGRGAHSVISSFQVPVQKNEGSPKIALQLPAIPVSRLRLRLPGRKEVTVEPFSNVSTRYEAEVTSAELFVPMTENVVLSWSEAVPEETKKEIRANAAIYSAVRAEEGVLYADAAVIFEISRGETNDLEFELPPNIQISRITSPSANIADWRVSRAGKAEPSQLNVFLDQPVSGELSFNISYDRSLAGEDRAGELEIPLLKARKVGRQKGMVALLSGKEIIFKPQREEGAIRVGENQLPPFFRQGLTLPVAHTYKFVESVPHLSVRAAVPERVQGKFDALVNTLISLGDATMKGVASVEMNVKSGKVQDLQLELPAGVNFLGISAPSLRSHKLSKQDDRQIVEMQFTQELDGQFRFEVTYELIMGESEEDLVVPTIRIRGAEVEQGRLAVEALSAVEVQTSAAERLSPLEPNELPQQLLLNTTNPILLAFKYAQAEPPYKLALRIVRHQEVAVQSGAIDLAAYHTLIVKDGIAVTRAEFTVRNGRKQFLRLQLPEGSNVWAAAVDGKPERPAFVEQSGDGKAPPQVLLKVINSAQPFPVSITYQSPISKIRLAGFVSHALPRLDMVVTRSVWNVYLPNDVTFGRLDTDMEVAAAGEAARPNYSFGASASPEGTPASLSISVPESGVRYSFAKLYAGQAEGDAAFTLAYTAGWASYAALLLSLMGGAMLGMAVTGLAEKEDGISRQAAAGRMVTACVILWVSVYYLKVSWIPPLAVAGLILAGAAAAYKQKHAAPESPAVEG